MSDDLARLHAELDACRRAAAAAAEELADLRSRVDAAQQLADMGDYDWHIASDTNRWSDHLYRIYGHEPQSFNPSYERFMEMLHPEDRETVQGVHQAAYASGDSYHMVERIVRPDGEVRFLRSDGEVVVDESGTPVRMRGTCLDITDRVLAQRERERSAGLFQSLVESSPEAILVLDAAGVVVQANQRADGLLGGGLIGRAIGEVLDLPGASPASAVPASSVDGRVLRLDVSTAALTVPGDGEERTAVFLQDAGPRLAAEALAGAAREAEVGRRQALQINDDVVQGLSSAIYALERGSTDEAFSLVSGTLRSARRMMNELLEPVDDPGAGDLVRAAAAEVERVPPVQVPAPAPGPDLALPDDGRPLRILVVDDAEDLRLLLRLGLETVEGWQVVGEAADGVEAVQQAASLQPDLVVLDLAMPRMDGLQALPLIRREAPDTVVVVQSGFDHRVMADRARGAGAHAYVEKGHSIAAVVAAVRSALDTAAHQGSGAPSLV